MCVSCCNLVPKQRILIQISPFRRQFFCFFIFVRPVPVSRLLPGCPMSPIGRVERSFNLKRTQLTWFEWFIWRDECQSVVHRIRVCTFLSTRKKPKFIHSTSCLLNKLCKRGIIHWFLENNVLAFVSLGGVVRVQRDQSALSPTVNAIATSGDRLDFSVSECLVV